MDNGRPGACPCPESMSGETLPSGVWVWVVSVSARAGGGCGLLMGACVFNLVISIGVAKVLLLL